MADREDDRTQEEIEADAAPDNAGNELAVRRKKGSTKDRVMRENEALSVLLASKNGRLLLRTFLYTVCDIDGEIVNAAYDPHAMHYKAGARRAGMIIRARCQQANQSALLMLITEEFNGEDK